MANSQGEPGSGDPYSQLPQMMWVAPDDVSLNEVPAWAVEMERREDLRDSLEGEWTEVVNAQIEDIEESKRASHNEAVPWDMESR